MKRERIKRLKKKGILVLKKANELQEVEFELDYLAYLSLNDRFSLMMAKTRELKDNLRRNGYREAATIIKRK